MEEKSKVKSQKSKVKNVNGFTIIELLFVFSVFTILSSVGVASFVTYSRSQTLSTSTSEFVTLLQVAKSKASSQVIPASCGTNHLTGYEVRVCGFPTSSCATANTYELHAVCGAASPLIATRSLATGITFDTASGSITSNSFLFNILSGSVSGVGKVTIKGYGSKKAVQVDSLGNISVQ